MNPTPVPLADVDLADLDVFERNEAWGMLRTRRRDAHMRWIGEPPSGGVLMLALLRPLSSWACAWIGSPSTPPRP